MSSCCLCRESQKRLPPSQDSAFDKELLDGFKRVLTRGGVIHTSPAQIRRRKIDGILGIMAQVSSDHFSKKRKAQDAHQKVVQPSNPSAFNFTKVEEAERITLIQVGMLGQRTTLSAAVIANVSPLALGHVLLVPECEQTRPQALSEELMLCGLQMLSMSRRHDFRLVFNSLMGFATVNHFHFHGLYLDYCGFHDSRFPMERVDRSLVAGNMKEGHVCIELLSETQWHTRGFVVSAGCKAGTQGGKPQADIEALACAAARLVTEMQKKNIPHNVILAPPQELKKERRQEIGMAHEHAEEKPDAISPEIYIIPRQAQANLRESAGFNAAVCEIAGLVVAHSDAFFDAFTEEHIKQAFSSDVSLESKVFDDLICKAAWLPH